MSKKVIAAGVACSLLMSGCAASTRDQVASSAGDLFKDLSSTLGSASGLAALPSDAPDSDYRDGGGGLIAAPAPVWGLPGARSASDPGIPVSKTPVATTISLRPEFTAAPGKGTYQFTVSDAAGKNIIWDSGQVSSSNDDCTISDQRASCTLPANKVGVLTNGTTYRLVTVAGGVTTARLFRVDVPQGVTGGTGTLILGRKYTSAVTSLQTGLSFTTAAEGAVPGSNVTNGPEWGLPPGWQWQGPTSGFVSITSINNAASYSGFTQLLSIDSLGNDQTLGCKTVTGTTQAVCGALSGDLPGIGYAAVIDADGSVVVTDQASGQNWTFNATDQLISSGAPGSAPVTYTYRTVAGAAKPVLDSMNVPASGWTWKFYYSGDSQCQNSSLPDGFVATPSGYACGWSEPDGGLSTILYTQPDGAANPRLSRVIQAPSSCPQWQNCDSSVLGIFDLGWDAKNRIEWQRQDALVDAAISGAIDQNDRRYWVRLEYDDLGRVSTITNAVNKADGSADSGPIGGAVDTYTYQSADSAYAPATTQVVRTSSLSGSPTTTEVIAIDDAGRTQFHKNTDGVVTSTVWDEDLPLKYADITNTAINTTSYDEFNRATANYAGNIAGFDISKCAPNAPDRNSKSCQPIFGRADAALSGTTYTYDQASATGNGLRAQWFDNANFSGGPVTTTEVNQPGSKGFLISTPASVTSSTWGASLNGGLVLNKAGTWNITVDVPKTMFSGGSLFVDNQVCALIGPGQTQASCTYTSDGSTYPLRLDLSHKAGGPASGSVVIALQQDEFSPAITGNSHFLQLWGAKQSQTVIDHRPDGSAINQVTSYNYDDPITPAPTNQSAGTNNGSHDALTRKTSYVPNGFGGAATSSIAGTSGTKKTMTYWGMTATPKSAGLPNLDQIPAAIQNTEQLGLPQVQTSASGHQQWTIYDVYGHIACKASVQQGNAPAWSCEERDGRGRLTKTIFRGQDGQTPIVVTYGYSFDNRDGSAPFVTQTTRTEGGQTSTEASREWPGGQLDTYAAADGSTTAYTYEPRGAVKTATTHIPGAIAEKLGAQAAANDTTLTYEYTYDDLGRPSTIANDHDNLATINYDSGNPRQIDSYDYDGGKISKVQDYDQYQRLAGADWKLADGTVTDKLTATAMGRKLTDQFDTVSDTYTYDGFSRLTKSSTTIAGTQHDFSYGWDDDSQRVCAAVDIANPAGKPCDSLAGAAAYKYKDNVLVSSSAPATNIPANALNKDSSFKQVGTQAYEYDALGKLIKVTDAAQAQAPTPTPSPNTAAPLTNEPTQITYQRGASERIVSQTTHRVNGDSSIAFIYGQSTDGQPIAAVSSDGTVTPMATLPGGLVLHGSQFQIPASSGTASLNLTADGARTGNVNVWGPYGEPVSTDPAADATSSGWRGQSSQLDGTLLNLGARSYRSDLGMFLQPDAISGGSGTMNDYAYVAGDPISSSDLNGNDFTQYFIDVFSVTLTLALQAVLAQGISMLVETLPESFLADEAIPARLVTFGLNAAVGMGAGLAADYLINGKLDLSTTALLLAGTSAVVSGIISAIPAPTRALETGIAEVTTADAATETPDWAGLSPPPEPEGGMSAFYGQTHEDLVPSASALDNPPSSPDSPSSFADSDYGSDTDGWTSIALDDNGSPAAAGTIDNGGWYHPNFEWSSQ